jgi:hypothetical protein
MVARARAAILTGREGGAVGTADGGTPAFHLMIHRIFEEQAV